VNFGKMVQAERTDDRIRNKETRKQKQREMPKNPKK
jgi:hypothetical protein